MNHPLTSPVRRVSLSALLGVVVGVLVALVGGPVWGILAGLAVEATAFTVFTWLVLYPASPDITARHARRDTLKPSQEEAVIVAIVVTGMGASALLGFIAPQQGQALAAIVALVGVLMQWFGLHAMYAARYAFEYYDDGPGTLARAEGKADAPEATRAPGGIDFNSNVPPCYKDFLYFSYNLGMTYQVSDTNVSTTQIRVIVMRHCLLSFLFSLIIMATTINIVMGVLTSA